MFKVFLIGSSIKNPETANGLDLIVVSDKPIDLCIYTPEQWDEFKRDSQSDKGQRIIIYPQAMKGNKLNGNIKPLIEVK